MSIVAVLLIIVFYFGILALMFWKVFQKAGKPGVASIVPIWNIIVLVQISGKPMWYLVFFFVPFLNYISFIFFLLVCLGIAEKFGKSAGFGVGMWLLGIVFFPILGFGDAVYEGEGNAAAIDEFGTAQSNPNTEAEEV